MRQLAGFGETGPAAPREGHAGACAVENASSVTCDAANRATGGTLTTSFNGTTTVNVNDQGRIDTGCASLPQRGAPR